MKDYTEEVLDLLEDINKIPRKSGNRGPITDYFKNWAHKNSFTCREDHVQNLVIEVPASREYEDSSPVVLQGHTDMVCEKTPESNHDFSTDPIIHVREGDWLSAENTSLGADNGIGLAMAMVAATNPEIIHPPLELLFTTDEEVGLWGADEIKPGFIRGKILLNLDSEDLGIFTLGCAGSAVSHLDFPIDRIRSDVGVKGLLLTIRGFRGGHSGDDIQKNRGNATAELIRGLDAMAKEIPFRMGSISGGSAMNAISRSAEAVITADPSQLEKIGKWWKEFLLIVAAENKAVEKNVSGDCVPADIPIEVFSSYDTKNILAKLRVIPHGVIHMNAELPDQVETSLNFGVLLTTDAGIRVTTMQRSAVKSRLTEITDRIETLADVLGAEYTLEIFSDPWQPDWSSPLVRKSTELWKNLYGEDPGLEVTHGGLECGVIGYKIGGMDMISFGPDIEDPHSPDEKLRISSVGKSFNFLTELLASFK
ncbi:MAG: beta-Ala-His dipeptidase [Spirochaetaceae bacterium]|nr:beta-Ala-His dipeptidase [Spirochaetaceae bacterium]